MTEGNTEAEGNAGRHYIYFVDGEKYEVQESSITGAEIKAKIPNFDPTFQLFLEGKGKDPDRAISDSDGLDLSHGALHLYTAPPATFGGWGSGVSA